MRGAVVTAFRRMLEVRRVLRHEALEKLLEVTARGRVGVLHHDEAAARMPNNMATVPVWDFTRDHRRRELVGDLGGLFAVGGHDDLGRLNTDHRDRAQLPLCTLATGTVPNEETSRKLKSKKTIRC